MLDLETSLISTPSRTILLSGLPYDGYFSNVRSAQTPEHDLLKLLNILLPKGGTMLDVGANIGLMTVAAGKIVGSKGQILSFEPSPQNFSILKHNIKINKLEKIVNAYNIGLSDKSNNRKLQYSNTNRGGAHITELGETDFYDLEEIILTRKLDAINTKIEKCDLVKVDIEGHEPFFLKGATKFIRKYKPAMIIEVNPWCLDVLNNITLPTYLKQIYNLYPYVYAFDSREIIDAKERQMFFMLENISNQRFQNLYCDFDRNRVELALHGYQKFLKSNKNIQNNTARLNTELLAENETLRDELEKIRNSKSHQIAIKLNHLVRNR